MTAISCTFVLVARAVCVPFIHCTQVPDIAHFVITRDPISKIQNLPSAFPQVV